MRSEQYRAATKVSPVVDVASLLLQVELQPVVEANHILLSRLANKHVLETTRVEMSAKTIIHGHQHLD